MSGTFVQIDWSGVGPLTWSAFAVLAVLLLAVAVEDSRSMLIPDRLNFALLLTGLGFATVLDPPGLLPSGLGALAGGALLWGVATGFRRFRGIEGLGMGDVKFAVGGGAWVGWEGLTTLVLVACTSALLAVGMAHLRGSALERHRPIPFGPHLCVGTALTWIALRLGVLPV